MSRVLSAIFIAFFGAAAVACGSGGSSTSPSDAGDATTSETGLSDVVDASGDGSQVVDDAGNGEAGSLSADAEPEFDAGPYIGSMPAPVTSALLRLANWSPDSPSADFCIAPHGTTAFQGPFVAAIAAATQSDAGEAGVAFPLVSAYALVAPGTYDFRIVVAGAASCAVGIHPDTALSPLAAGGAATVAMMGVVTPTAGIPKLRVVPFADDLSAAAGTAAIRVINASPGMPQADVGTGTLASKKFLAIFRNVSFGMTGQPPGGWIPFLVDANGYNANQPISNTVLSAHLSGATSDGAQTSSPTSIAVADVVTIVVVGGTSGVSPSLVECFDTAGIADTLSDCIVSM
jgi:hypothetical protein